MNYGKIICVKDQSRDEITKEEDMTNQEILSTYKKMGLGSQEERNQFLQWSPEINAENNNFVFIIETPYSETITEDKNAQLAPNSK